MNWIKEIEKTKINLINAWYDIKDDNIKMDLLNQFLEIRKDTYNKYYTVNNYYIIY
jgi:hypothetical protein